MPRRAQAVGIRADPALLPSRESHAQGFLAQALQAEALGDWQTAAGYYAEGLRQRSAELTLINSVQEGLSSQLQMQAIYDLVGDKLRETFDAQVVMISQYDPLTKLLFHRYAIERGRHLQIQGWQPLDVSRAEIVRMRRPLMIHLDEIVKLIESAGMHVVPGTELPKTWLGVPMLVRNEVRGIVSLQNLDKGYAFSQSDIDLLTALTNSLSLSLENARLFNETRTLLDLMEGEMGIARRTQKGILPSRMPRHPGYDIGALIMPARAVGGDFYDFIHLDRQRLCIVIGDVADKGLPAALFMALTFSLVRSETGRTGNPREILANVNRYLLRMNASGVFVTLVYCVLDFATGLLQYSRAGHLLPIILDGDAKCLDVAMQEGQPLGVFEDVRIDQQELRIPDGGLVLLYSDGLNEATDAKGNELGFERVKQELSAHRSEHARTICRKLWQAVQHHIGPLPQQDDFTAVIVKRHSLAHGDHGQVMP